MASFVAPKSGTYIEYSFHPESYGHVREFTHLGKDWLDVSKGIEIEGWKKELAEILPAIEEYQKSGRFGIAAFVEAAKETGGLPVKAVIS